LTGRIPSVAETRAFLSETAPDRRIRLVERLLASPQYVAHSVNVYRALMIPEAGNNFVVRLQQGGFEQWLKQQVTKDVGYDQLVTSLLTAPLGNSNPILAFGGGGSSPIAFYSAKEFKAESLAAGTARAFLGVSVECAQCHNHPFANWKREEFWSLAAFYSGVRSTRAMDIILPAAEVADQKEMTIPGTETVVQARFLDGTQPDWKGKSSTRAAFAEWVTSPTNPYFAKATVNRTWAYFFGTGLVEPIDEMVGTDSITSHPAVLDLLTREFINHKFDTKFLTRAITATKAYQLTSAGKEKAHDDPTLFARMPLRGMTPEQLFDSVAMATGYRNTGSSQPDLISAIAGATNPRAEFLTKFATQSERATKTQTSILQALSLMNGKIISGATSLEQSELLAAVVDAPFMSTGQRIETIYLATLCRQPSTKELDRATRFIDSAERRASPFSSAARRDAYNHAVADLFWALLNSSEFVLNH
jgi:hypothetical protein